jgi:MtN3 and saliva related transmembrane protein
MGCGNVRIHVGSRLNRCGSRRTSLGDGTRPPTNWHRSAANFTNFPSSRIYSAASSAASKVSFLHPSVELIGSLAALITTLAWLPQILKILRERRTEDISLITNAALATGIFLWMLYGLFIGSWPIIMANGVTFLFIATIIGLKLRYG